MAGSVNKCLFIGRAGKDPEIKYTQAGDPVANFSIAVSESWKDSNGEKQERTTWVNIVAWKKLAEIIGKYLKKGQQVYIEGKIQTRTYEDKEGVKRYVTEIVANQMVMLGNKPSGDDDHEGVDTAKKAAYKKGGKKAEPEGSAFDIGDDDIPF